MCGAAVALELELTGGTFDAERALRANMVSQVVPLDDLITTAEAIARRIIRNPRRGVESAKETILDVIGRQLDDFFEGNNPVSFGTGDQR
jgi:enoyl-CoA hydratase/carnithine racemase